MSGKIRVTVDMPEEAYGILDGLARETQRSKADQGGKPAAGHRAVRPLLVPAIDHGRALPALDLADELVVADEETALGDMPFGRRRDEGGVPLRGH